MPLPDTIAVRFTEEDAGYVTVRPVVRQTFRLGELADMVVSVTGKNAARVQQIFRAGSVVYNGYRYWWDGFTADENDIMSLLAKFPDDDSSRPFPPTEVSAIALEIGGGTQRVHVTLTRAEASAKKLFSRQSPWDLLLAAASASFPRYEKFSHADHADLFRLHLAPESAAALMKNLLPAARRALHKKLAPLPLPAALLFFAPRTKTPS